MSPFVLAALVLAVLFIVAVVNMVNLVHTCAPNEVLVFYGKKRRDGGSVYGFRVIKGGFGVRWPLIERVARMDLTNMVIDISATNAYSKGGIPLTVQGVANVKVAGHEPLINNAIERFLGKSRLEIVTVAKATLEGSLRGILATMTPEQVNEDKILFAERLVSEVEQDLTNLGLVVDTMKIQNVQDEVKYLESIGRKRSAEVICKARIAEAEARADAMVRMAENKEREQKAAIDAQTEIVRADAARRLMEVQTRRAAVVAEEQAQVTALLAQAKAEIDVQKARVEQVRQQLEADVVAPARANSEAAEANARASVASIVEDGRARADALRTLSETWKAAGENGRQVLLANKLDRVIRALTDTIPETRVEKVTMIDSRAGGNSPARAIGALEQIKQVFGIDVVEKVKALGEPKPETPAPAAVAFEVPAKE